MRAGSTSLLDVKKNGTLIVPHLNWRGLYQTGTDSNGGDCKVSGACAGMSWPGSWRKAYLGAAGAAGIGRWYGSLLTDQQDASGLLYRRNRYYDPETGQFTQEDPIGIAGGLNLYGYANGDPINFSDPFGLCPQWLTGRPCSGGVDFGAGFVPGVSTGVDAATLVSGENPLTGEEVGFGGRLVAFVGLATPASGGQVRGLLSGAKHVLSRGLQRVTGEFTDRVLQRTYRHAIREINRHKEILANASPEQVPSITEDLVKHEKWLQAAVEEMERRGIRPGG